MERAVFSTPLSQLIRSCPEAMKSLVTTQMGYMCVGSAKGKHEEIVLFILPYFFLMLCSKKKGQYSICRWSLSFHKRSQILCVEQLHSCCFSIWPS